MARPWSPSLVLIERMSARWSVCRRELRQVLADPDARDAVVAIALYGPPLAWPGLRSNVSIWLGPPFIQSRMHDRRRCGLGAASAASVFIQPAGELTATPAAASRSHCRRLNSSDRCAARHGGLLGAMADAMVALNG